MMETDSYIERDYYWALIRRKMGPKECRECNHFRQGSKGGCLCVCMDVSPETCQLAHKYEYPK